MYAGAGRGAGACTGAGARWIGAVVEAPIRPLRTTWASGFKGSKPLGVWDLTRGGKDIAEAVRGFFPLAMFEMTLVPNRR